MRGSGEFGVTGGGSVDTGGAGSVEGAKMKKGQKVTLPLSVFYSLTCMAAEASGYLTAGETKVEQQIGGRLREANRAAIEVLEYE